MSACLSILYQLHNTYFAVLAVVLAEGVPNPEMNRAELRKVKFTIITSLCMQVGKYIIG